MTLYPYQVDGARFLADGEQIGRAAARQKGEVSFTRPAGEEGRPVAITVEAGTWSPARAGENQDTRELSVMLRDVVVEPLAGEAPEEPDVVDQVLQVGEGHIAMAIGTMAETTAQALGALVRSPDKYGVPPLSPEAAADAQEDLVYLTVTTKDILLYNHGSEDKVIKLPTGDVQVPAHTIVSAPLP